MDKKKTRRRVLMLLLLLVFLFSLGMVGRRLLDYRRGGQTYDEARELAALPDLSGIVRTTPPPAEEERPSEPLPSEPREEAVPTPEPAAEPDPYEEALSSMDLTALQALNPDVVGWIFIPDTSVSYPIVQGRDNREYLDLTWKREWSGVGSIFLECRNSPDFSDFNTIIYGHRMIADLMFHCLTFYREQTFYDAHPQIYLTDSQGVHVYDIFSAYEASVTDQTYRLEFDTEAERQDYLDACVSRSVPRTGIVPTVEDRVLTLSTCVRSNDAKNRWVVHAVLRADAN